VLLASWNVNSINVRLGHLLSWLQEISPDVVCLQETKTVDEKFPADALASLGYSSQYYGEKSYNGVAIVSKLPLERVQKGFKQDVEPGSKRFIEAQIGPLRVLNCYIPNGQAVGSEKYLYKMMWLEGLLNHLKKEHDPLLPLLLCGDFNIAPEDRDIYDAADTVESIMCSTEEREKLASIRSWGLEDAFRKHNQENGQFTWWDYRMGGFRRNIGFRIDHIYCTKPAYAACRAAFIDKSPRKLERPSDHTPILARLEF
jgi:exodeoxyribonuclease-3